MNELTVLPTLSHVDTYSKVVAHEAVNDGIDKRMSHSQPMARYHNEYVPATGWIIAEKGIQSFRIEHPDQLEDVHGQPADSKQHDNGDEHFDDLH